MRFDVSVLALAVAGLGCSGELTVSPENESGDGLPQDLMVDSEGAVNLPAGAGLALPFPAGHRIAIRSAYGPSAGSILHTGKTRTDKGNDYFALDLIYADEPSGGRGMPILAPLPGIVVKRGWASGGWANFGLRVILRHDLGDGHVYHSSYAHLNAIADGIEEGSTVVRGQLLGELGRSCQGTVECASFDWPHLHFSIHRDSAIGGTGSGSTFGGSAVIPEPLDGQENLSRGQSFLSSNQPVGCDRPDCGPPLGCDGRPDGAYCYGSRKRQCAGGQLVSEVTCAQGCTQAECRCHSSRLGRPVDSGDCIQVGYASCGQSSCGWWSCHDGAWACAQGNQCGPAHALAGCTNSPPGQPPPPPRCYSNRLGRSVESGDCVQVTYASCGATTCGWWTCAAGSWACLGATSCPGDVYAHPSCGG